MTEAEKLATRLKFGDEMRDVLKELDLSKEAEKEAFHIFDLALEEGASRKKIDGLIGGAIYTSAEIKEEYRSQRLIADAVGVSKSTIRKNYREMLPKIVREKLIDEFEGMIGRLDNKSTKKLLIHFKMLKEVFRQI